LACPYFRPTQKWEECTWPHPSRLPLGAGWQGRCSAPGYEGVEPASEELKEFCNLGYALKCSRLPADRSCDAVRFSVARDDGSRLLLCFVFEAGHRPVAHGSLEYDSSARQWLSQHPDSRIQALAECYLQSYRRRSAPAGPQPSNESSRP